MIRSSRRRAAGAALVVAALAIGGTAQAGSPHAGKTIQLTEAHAQIKPVFADTGDPGPTVGDLVVVRDGVLDAHGESAGTLNQVCTLVELNGGPLTSSYECSGSIALAAGTITMQGPLVPSQAEQTAAVTGGTGAFEKARGQIVVRAEGDSLVVELA
jgi:hypothetical protein